MFDSLCNSFIQRFGWISIEFYQYKSADAPNILHLRIISIHLECHRNPPNNMKLSGQLWKCFLLYNKQKQHVILAHIHWLHINFDQFFGCTHQNGWMDFHQLHSHLHFLSFRFSYLIALALTLYIHVWMIQICSSHLSFIQLMEIECGNIVHAFECYWMRGLMVNEIEWENIHSDDWWPILAEHFTQFNQNYMIMIVIMIENGPIVNWLLEISRKQFLEHNFCFSFFACRTNFIIFIWMWY